VGGSGVGVGAGGGGGFGLVGREHVWNREGGEDRVILFYNGRGRYEGANGEDEGRRGTRRGRVGSRANVRAGWRLAPGGFQFRPSQRRRARAPSQLRGRREGAGEARGSA